MLQPCCCMVISESANAMNGHLVCGCVNNVHMSVPCGGGTPVQAEILFVTICLKQSCYELLLRLLRLAPQKLPLISTLCVVSFSSVLCGTNTWASLHYTHLLSLSLKPAPTHPRVFRNDDIVVLFHINIT